MSNRSSTAAVKAWAGQIVEKIRASFDVDQIFPPTIFTKVFSPFHIYITASCSLSAILILLGWQWDQKLAKSDFQNLMFSLGLNMFNSTIFLFFVEFFLNPSARNRVILREGVNYDGFVANIRKSKKQIDIFATFLGPFTSLPAYDGMRKKLCDAIMVAHRNNQSNPDYRIRILLLVPWSKAAEQRSEDLKGLEEFESYLNECIITLFELREDPNFLVCFGKIEVHFYEFLPPFFLLRCDGDASAIHYLPKRSLRSGERIEFKVNSQHGAAYLKTFEYAWKQTPFDTLDTICNRYYIQATRVGSKALEHPAPIPYANFGSFDSFPNELLLIFDETSARHNSLYVMFLEEKNADGECSVTISRSNETRYDYKIISINHFTNNSLPGCEAANLRSRVFARYGPGFTKFARLQSILPEGENQSAIL